MSNCTHDLISLHRCGLKDACFFYCFVLSLLLQSNEESEEPKLAPLQREGKPNQHSANIGSSPRTNAGAAMHKFLEKLAPSLNSKKKSARAASSKSPPSKAKSRVRPNASQNQPIVDAAAEEKEQVFSSPRASPHTHKAVARSLGNIQVLLLPDTSRCGGLGGNECALEHSPRVSQHGAFVPGMVQRRSAMPHGASTVLDDCIFLLAISENGDGPYDGLKRRDLFDALRACAGYSLDLKVLGFKNLFELLCASPRIQYYEQHTAFRLVSVSSVLEIHDIVLLSSGLFRWWDLSVKLQQKRSLVFTSQIFCDAFLRKT